MRKKPKRSTTTGGRQQTFFPLPPPRPLADVDADVIRAAGQRHGELPGEVRREIHDAAARVAGRGPTEWDWFRGRSPRAAATPAARDENEFINTLIETAVDAGFRLALERYAEQLRGVPELAAWEKKRTAGGIKGHETQSQRAQQRYKEIRETFAAMQAAGEETTNPALVARTGYSLSTVIRAFKSKPAARRKR